jgi:hypothetical protein
MESIMKTSPLTYNEAELYLPDYALGKLAPEEAARLEEALQNFPDLKVQAASIKAAFEQLNPAAFRSEIDNRTRDLSVRVHERLRKQSSARRTGSRFVRWSPIVLMAASLAFFYLVPRDTMPVQKPAFEEELEQILSATDGNVLVSIADRDADLELGEPVRNNHSMAGSELMLLQDAAEEIVRAAQPSIAANKDNISVESLELLIHTEIQDAEMVLKELEDVAS